MGKGGCVYHASDFRWWRIDLNCGVDHLLSRMSVMVSPAWRMNVQY